MAEESAALIRKAGGVAIQAPSMREIPLAENHEAFAFAEELTSGTYDIVICMTGVGTRHLFAAMETQTPLDDLVAAISATCVVARGPKSAVALRGFGVPIAVTVPEPNTWREIIAAIEKSANGRPLDGASVALQEYGVANTRLEQALRERGAKVRTVPVYKWALPADTKPLRDAIAEILARTADLLLVTSATQVRHLLAAAAQDGCEEQLRHALRELAICSIGPVSSESLAELGLPPDFEPARSKLGGFVKEVAAKAADLVDGKREHLRRRAAVVEQTASSAQAPGEEGLNTLDDSPFMLACRRKPVPYTPVWLMRQAGRYMQEYREVRARIPFIELCKRPELAAEVAVTAQRRIGADAAILFSDILLIVEPMGLGLRYVGGEGPSITQTVREGADVERLREVDPFESLAFVADAIRTTRRELAADIPLIGFSGAPFTLASYIVEGGGSKNYVQTKSLMWRDPGAWHAMMETISRSVARYLNMQAEAGAQALQIFDSWVGCLSPDDYRRFVLPHTKAVIDALTPGVPVIHFGTGCPTLLDMQASCGTAVLGADHRVDLDAAFDRYPGIALQGNLDPVVLFSSPPAIVDATARVLASAAGRPGHIFNLGHGILPATPVDSVIALVDAVHELSAN